MIKIHSHIRRRRRPCDRKMAIQILQHCVTVNAHIDPKLTVDVERQLCINIEIKEPPVYYALRDETDDLVTIDNLRKKSQGEVRGIAFVFSVD
jgi:hypothetical protein